MSSVLSHCAVSALFFLCLWVRDWARAEADEEEHYRQLAQLARQHEREMMSLANENSELRKRLQAYRSAYGNKER